jgi:hypothetical protein
MTENPGAQGSRSKKPTQPGTRKRGAAAPAEEAGAGEEALSQKPAAQDEPVNPSQSVPDPSASVPNAEELERLRNRLMAKYHGRRR